MSRRRPTIEIFFALLDELKDRTGSDVDSVRSVKDLDVIFGSGFRLYKIHPLSTDFGLQTLVEFLQNELKQKIVKEQKLKVNPHLAAAESEKHYLRKLVNSGRPIALDVRNGRLEVRLVTATRRAQSAPASEGDNECSRRHRRAGSASVSNSSKRQNRLLDRPPCVDNSTTSSWTSQNLNVMQSNNNRSGSQRRYTLDGTRAPAVTALSHPHLQSRSRLLTVTGRPALSQPLDNADSTKFPVLVLDVSARDTSVSADGSEDLATFHSSCHTSQNATDRLNSQPSSSTAFARSLSFERHTDEVRHSTRAAMEATGLDIPGEEIKSSTGDNNINDDVVISRRKIAKPQERVDLSAEALKLSLDHSLNGNGSQQSSVLGDCSPTLSADASVTSDESQSLSLESHCGRAISDAICFSGNLADPLRLLPSSLTTDRAHKGATNGRKAFSGKDTFYSASSDENSCVSDQDEVLEMQTSHEEGVFHGDHRGDAFTSADNCAKRSLVHVFDYNNVVPESVPADIRQARENRQQVWSVHGLDFQGQPDFGNKDLWYTTQFTMEELNPNHQNILGAPDKQDVYPRKSYAQAPPTSTNEPPHCAASFQGHEFTDEILESVCPYLSSHEMRNLRLVNRATAKAVFPHMIRSVVFDFGPTLFMASDGGTWDAKSDGPATGSIISNHGSEINKFGISFNFDPIGLANAEPKSVEETVHAWFGNYVWPLEKYPHFQQLKTLEDLVDANRPLLKNTMKSLTGATELAISVDSGHGWLNGPDISDLAILRAQRLGGSKVFGKKFAALDKAQEAAFRQYFSWGQLNTINTCVKQIAGMQEQFGLSKKDIRVLRKYRIRHYDAFEVQKDQRDFNRTAHVGGELQSDPAPAAAAPATIPVTAPPAPIGIFTPPVVGGWLFPLQNSNIANTVVMPANAPLNSQANALANTMNVAGPNHGPVAVQPLPATYLPLVQLQAAQGNVRPYRRARRFTDPRAFLNGRIVPQWPLLFNCHNLAAEVCGSQSFVQNQTASPADFPYMPGELNETQVQWLMETVWAQRAFLSAYTNSIISNAGIFKEVHSLHIAKLSSGLIPAVTQRDFWTALPNLKKLTIMISPDWRQEHVAGDKLFHRSMLISPVQASVKLAELLHVFVNKIESLSVLKTGFVGGGEHQTGLFARNCHILPAPITFDPQAWITDHAVKPDLDTMFAFNHVRELTFENCWFSPCMLEAFMRKSRDTSLHHLILDSVSLTGIHDTRHDGPQTVENSRLRCEFSPSEWFLESIPRNACWVNVLENITPGKTILARKHDAKLINEEEHPRPPPSFRGNIKKITLNSVGYVKVGGVRLEQFCQNGLIEQSSPWHAMDEGLEARKKLFYVGSYHKSPSQRSAVERTRPNQGRRGPTRDAKDEPKMCIMMSTKDPETQSEFFGLGKLTQCVHPVEKRVLERAWGMRFGWGDDMERWAAVEDGWYEGGTGRFSGTIERDHDYDGI